MTQRDNETAPRRLADKVFMVGGPDLSDPRDCLCYLLAGERARVLIDCGAGPSARRILDLASSVCEQPLTHLYLTHNHIDHAGGAAQIKRLTGCQVLIHALDAPALAQGDPVRSAASWYGLPLESLTADLLLGEEDVLQIAENLSLNILHTPGHTPGSTAAWCQVEGQRVLFGQDIHGPFSPAFGSDLGQWRRSMDKLMALRADILAEGHYGVFRPAQEVEAFFRQQLAAHA